MTQIATVRPPSAAQGPQGVGAHGLGGAYTPFNQQDIINTDAFQGPVTEISGSSDVINPHASGNYVVKTAGVDAMTIGVPTAGVDDNLSIAIYSDTANAHTLTAPSAIFATGKAGANLTVLTFLAGRGSGVQLRAYNGTWQVIGNNGVTSA